MTVVFSGLRSGTYPVHVHSRCNGNQSYHIAVVESLQVSSYGSGAIGVASFYSGRGLCLIVYLNTALSAVVTTRTI